MAVQSSSVQSRNARYESLSRQPGIITKDQCRTLALVGFYHQANGILRCCYCGQPFSSWDGEGGVYNIWYEHIRTVPRCIHVVATFGIEVISRILLNENAQYTLSPEIIEVFKGYKLEQRNESFYIPDTFGTNAPIYQSQQNRNSPLQLLYVTLYGDLINDPKFPERGVRQRRLDTYNCLPGELPLHAPLDMINASGFFFMESTRKFVCYFCGVSMDPCDYEFLDDPWKRHALVSDCGHVHFTKGGSFTHQVRNGNIISTSDYDRDAESFILRDLQMMEDSMKSVGRNANGKRRKEEENENDDENAVRIKSLKENMGKQESGNN